MKRLLSIFAIFVCLTCQAQIQRFVSVQRWVVTGTEFLQYNDTSIISITSNSLGKTLLIRGVVREILDLQYWMEDKGPDKIKSVIYSSNDGREDLYVELLYNSYARLIQISIVRKNYILTYVLLPSREFDTFK